MLEATPSLSPKALERIRRFRSAVRTIALYRAKQAVREDIRAQGLKLGEFSARDIAIRAEAILAERGNELLAAATRDVATFPEFARFDIGANLSSVAQTQNTLNSMGSAVQQSGAK